MKKFADIAEAVHQLREERAWNRAYSKRGEAYALTILNVALGIAEKTAGQGEVDKDVYLEVMKRLWEVRDILRAR